MKQEGGAASALRGIRVVDFSAMIAGPYCTRWLADLGADVVKVESPDGDHMRHRPPLRDGHSAFFGHLNAGKRCIVVDLKHPEGKQVARRLIERADVLVEAFRPGVMERLGLSFAQARAWNPGLIYCSISGFGQGNDWSDRPAYAPVVHAASGFDLALGRAADGSPVSAAMPLADVLTAMFAAFSIQTALLKRSTDGRGTFIDVNLMDSALGVMPYEFQAAQQPHLQPRPVYRPLRAADGWILVTPINQRNFLNLCVAAGRPEWREDPLLATESARFENWDGFMARIESWSIRLSAEHCESVLTRHGVPCARHRPLEEVINDPQFEQRSSFGTVVDGAGGFLATRLPFAFDGVRPTVGATSRPLASDTTTVLLDDLAMSRDELERLRRAGAVACADQGSTPSPSAVL